MRADDRVALLERQREVVTDLVVALRDLGPAAADAGAARRPRGGPDDAARLRVVVDQVASLTDASALAWHARLTG